MADQLAVHLPVLALHARRERDLRGLLELVAQDRKLLEDDAHVLVGLDQLRDVAEAALAVAAVVVEELDDGDVAVGIAGDRRVCG